MKAATWVPMNNQLWFRRISTTRINCAQPRQRGFPGSSAGKESTCNARDPVQFLGWKIPWRRDRLLTPVFLGFPGGSDSKESTCNAGDLGSTPGFGRSPGGGHGNPCQYSCLENPHGRRSLAGYSPWGQKETDMTE